VLIGEASHGTHEFYDQRARIPRRLIEECGFTAVAAVEADWPDAYRAKWGLPADYPMVAPNYAEQRRTLAKKIGLGTKRRKAAR